jgi:Zn ribbon nucleic-acid-binding protein
MYNKSDLMPKRYPQEKPIFFDVWVYCDKWQEWRAGFWDERDYWDEAEVKWFINIPGAPDEVKPLAYPEHKPSESGMYIVHNKELDFWDTIAWRREISFYWRKLVDYFIDIRLEPPENIEELAKDDVSEVIWNTNSLRVWKSKHDPTLNFLVNPDDIPEYQWPIEIGEEELTWFSLRWLNHEGYDVVKREEEIAPCPFCGGECDVFYECDDVANMVECERCGYRSRFANTSSEAIRLHNQIAGRE